MYLSVEIMPLLYTDSFSCMFSEIALIFFYDYFLLIAAICKMHTAVRLAIKARGQLIFQQLEYRTSSEVWNQKDCS